MPQRPGTLTESCCHSPGLLPLGVARKVGLRTGAPPSTPTRGVPSGHLGGERSPFLAHWLHNDGYGGGQPLVVHLRREEEVISADDGHAESGRSAEEGAQRVAAARLGAGGMAGGGGTPACPRSSHPHTQAEPRTAAREFGRVSKDRDGEGPDLAQRVILVSHRGGATAGDSQSVTDPPGQGRGPQVGVHSEI